MREILFRGKRLDTDEWTRGCLVRPEGLINLKKTYILEDCISVQYDGSRHAFGGFVEVDPETVGQFTGVLARGRLGIFEGDVIIHYNRPGDSAAHVVGVVFWDEESCSFKKRNICNGQAYDLSPSCDYEIIGNIYDDPELLRGERNGTA